MPLPLRRVHPGVLWFAVLALAVTVQKAILVGHAGNFLLFRYTFHRLIGGGDIYYPPAGEMTGFLYSPTFGLLFAPFAVLPLFPGLLLWNLVNAVALALGLALLLPRRAASLALLIVLLDTVRSMQNSQSNALVAGLIVLAFLALERERDTAAALAVVTGCFIKIYPLGAGVMGLLGQRRGRFLARAVLAVLVFAALPLLARSPAGVLGLYREWWAILRRDSGLQGDSVMRLLTAWFGLHIPNWPVQLAGLIALLAPVLARRAAWLDPAFRTKWLSSLLVFFLIFNHQAESASFVVGATGLAIWFATTAHTPWRTTLVVLALLLASVPRLFFVPGEIYHNVVEPYALTVAPYLTAWIALQVELWHQRNVPAPEPLPQRA